jgi:hypothetical protein
MSHHSSSKNALRILLSHLLASPSPLSLFLRASLIARCSAPARRGLTQARPFFFSPPSIPYYISSLQHLHPGGPHSDTVWFDVPLSLLAHQASGPGGAVYVVTLLFQHAGLSESCSPHHRCNRRVSSRGQMHITLTCTLSSSDHITSAPITQSPRRGTSPPHNRVFCTVCRSVSMGRFRLLALVPIG